MSLSYRVLEIIPGVLTWLTLILVVVASHFVPVWAAVFIIIFDTYWFFKTIFLSLHLRYSFNNMRSNLKIDWLKKVEGLEKQWKHIFHLIVIPMSTESYEILKETFVTLSNSNYPKDHLIVVLSFEERIGDSGKLIAERINKEFEGKFFRLIVTRHPANLPGEIVGSGSNETWGAKEAKRLLIDPLQIPYEDILVSIFDADTQVPKDYFGRLMYCFLKAEKPQRSSYQPIPLYNNNIYEAPSMARVVALSSTFWHMLQQARPEKVTTFSSHSMPFKALVEVGFWQTDIVSDDSRIFWQLYLHYNSDWRVIPMLYPVSMDANVAQSFWGTMANIYKQQRRWAWGSENIPYILNGFIENKKVSLKEKIYWGFNKIEAFHSWATNALLIFALGWLPLFLGGDKFNDTLLSFNLPIITRTIMLFASVGIVTSAIMGMILLPPKPDWFRKRHYLLYIIQWALLPLSMIVFGAFPAIDAQTRLMLGGKFKLGFWVTPKIRPKSD
jgi:hypothetical protein